MALVGSNFLFNSSFLPVQNLRGLSRAGRPAVAVVCCIVLSGWDGLDGLPLYGTCPFLGKGSEALPQHALSDGREA